MSLFMTDVFRVGSFEIKIYFNFFYVFDLNFIFYREE